MAMLKLDERYRYDHYTDLRDGPGMQVLVHEVAPGDKFLIGEARVVVRRTDHRPITPTIGFRIEAEGKSVVLAGDTVPCAELDDLCRGADIYVQTVLRPDLVELVKQFVPALTSRTNDILDYHSSVEDAAKTAACAGVKTLMLTHFVPAMQSSQEADWLVLATPHFSGSMVLGPDLTNAEV